MILQSQLEALLYASSHPLPIKKISSILKLTVDEVVKELESFQKVCETENRGVRVVIDNNNAELATSPMHSELVKTVVEYTQTAVTDAKIETLTILAYYGPLTKTELEAIRGVNCSLILRNLKIDGLIDKIGDAEPQFYVTTVFLKILGIASCDELPDYHTLRQSFSKNDH